MKNTNMNTNISLMAWNEPGGNKQDNSKERPNHPWGNGNRHPGPPDLEQLIKKWILQVKKRLNFSNKTGKGGGGGSIFNNGNGYTEGPKDFARIGSVVGIVVLVVLIISGIFIVEPPERAVITRFGRYVRTEGPGPHWLFPLIESKEVINVEQVATSDHSGLMLTRDRNIASVGVAVQYRIGDGENDLRSYLFNVVNPIQSLRMSAESALRYVVGQSTMDEVLTLRRAEIATAIKEHLIETLKGYNTGIEVIDVAMQFAKAPDEVRAAFDDVIKAAADEERLINQAHAYENEVLPRARGTVEQMRNGAKGYREETILIAEGNVQRFNAILPQYQKAPKVTQTRLYLETMEQILAKTSKVVVDSNIGNNLLYLPIDKLISEANFGSPSANNRGMSGSASSNMSPSSSSSGSHALGNSHFGQTSAGSENVSASSNSLSSGESTHKERNK